MTHSTQHAFDAEEVMAYLDGALEPTRAAALAAHLDGCGDCQTLAKTFRTLTDRMMSFEVEPAPATLNARVMQVIESPATTMLPETKRPSVWNEWKQRLAFSKWPLVQRVPRGWLATGGLAVGALAIAALVVGVQEARVARMRHFAAETGLSAYMPNAQDSLALSYEPKPSPPAASRGKTPVFRDKYSGDPLAKVLNQSSNVAARENVERYAAENSAEAEPSDDNGGGLAAPEISGPMVEQNVALHIVPSNFDDASATLEKLAAAHGGYVANLSASAQTGSARDVNVELRIPAKQAPAFVDAARKLGKVVDESRSSVEVTADYVDLQARLKAAKAAEQRLVELLGNRTGKLSDVLEVERELTRVRSEIESMQGQANVLLHQVAYATVKIELSEEYHVTLQSDGSVWHKLRDAAVSGFRNLEESIVGALVFLLDAGLSILFWGAVIFGAAWLVRRKIRARRTPSTSAV
jgi:hypothetical protein